MEEDPADMCDEILKEIDSVQDQLTRVANKVDMLLTPKLKELPALQSPADRIA